MTGASRREQASCAGTPLAGGGSVQAPAPQAGTGDALEIALDGCSGFSLANLGGLLIEFPPAHFGDDACLLAGAPETPQGEIERFVFLYTYSWHGAL